MGTIAELVVKVRAENSAFNSGMDDVSKRARKTKRDVEDSFNFNTDGATKGFTNVRASLGLLDNSIRGNHAAAMADLVREFSQTSFVMAALPFAAMAGVALLAAGGVFELVKKIQELRQEEEKLRNAQLQFDTAVNNAFNSLRDKLLQAGIRADELNNNHLAALKKQLQLIDHQSMDDLSQSFDTVKKAADDYFKQLEAHWYSFGIGSAGAKHALDDFQIQYNALLAKGDKTGANDKLVGSLQQWEHLLALQKEAKAAGDKIEGSGGIFPDEALKFERDRAELKKYGLGITEDEIKSQEKLVAVGHDLLDIQKLEADRRSKERGTAIETGKKADLDQQVADAKKASDAETKEYIAGLELQLSQFKITQAQFEQLKQAALDKQFNDELAHLEKLKTLYAGQPEMLKQVNAQEDALAAEHNAQIIADATKTFNEQTRLVTELGRLSSETAQKQAEEQNKANDQAMKAIEEKNKVLLDDLKTIDAAGDNRVKQINKEIENLRRLKEQYQLTGKAKLDIDTKIHALQQQRDKDINDEMMRSGKLGKIFHATLNEMITDGKQWQVKIAQTFQQTVGQMNTSLAQFLVEGQGNWKQFAVSAIESIVQVGLQYAESKAMMAILDAMGLGEKKTKNAAEAQSSANTAAANTLADVPFPANIAASAAVLSIGEAFSIASMTAERGAVLPNSEALVHTHPQEMILPQHISNFIKRGAAMAMGRGGRGGGGGHTFNIHLHDVTDGQGIERMVTKQVIPIIRRELSWGRA